MFAASTALTAQKTQFTRTVFTHRGKTAPTPTSKSNRDDRWEGRQQTLLLKLG